MDIAKLRVGFEFKEVANVYPIYTATRRTGTRDVEEATKHFAQMAHYTRMAGEKRAKK